MKDLADVVDLLQLLLVHHELLDHRAMAPWPVRPRSCRWTMQLGLSAVRITVPTPRDSYNLSSHLTVPTSRHARPDHERSWPDPSTRARRPPGVPSRCGTPRSRGA